MSMKNKQNLCDKYLRHIMFFLAMFIYTIAYVPKVEAIIAPSMIHFTSDDDGTFTVKLSAEKFELPEGHDIIFRTIFGHGPACDLERFEGFEEVKTVLKTWQTKKKEVRFDGLIAVKIELRDGILKYKVEMGPEVQPTLVTTGVGVIAPVMIPVDEEITLFFAAYQTKPFRSKKELPLGEQLHDPFANENCVK